jgi:hypothetical protein
VNLTVTCHINIDASRMTPREADDWLDGFVALRAAPKPTPGTATTLVTPIPGVDRQLARLTDFNPSFAARVRAVHAGLMELGYVPTLPKSKSGKKDLPSYLAYIDPVTGQNLGNLNSEKFYVMRGVMRDELAAREFFGADSRYAHIHLTSDAAVEALLRVGREQKAAPGA